jgi:hypothetical protein
MPIPKRKLRRGKKKSKGGNKKPQGKVYMPQKKDNVTVLKRKKKLSLKKRKKGHSKKKGSSLSRVFFFYLFLPLLFIFLLYLSVLFIKETRDREDKNLEEFEYVIGLEKIPAYPNSEFIFTNSLNEASVANFLSSGNSAYRLPSGTSPNDISNFYNQELPSRGWSLVLSVDVGSEEMRSGEYWVKEGKGLRIYSKFNDIWYESISETDAMTGLRARVIREVERDLLLADENLQDLLPDYSWILNVPKEYIISYSVSSFKNMRSVQLKKIGSKESVEITPIGSLGRAVLDDFLRMYIDELNEDSGELWGITNTVIVYTEYGQGLRGSISSKGEEHDIAVIPNSYDNVVYVIDANTPNDPFFEYVLENLKPQGVD